MDVGGDLIDPRTADVGGQYEELVEDNIRASIEAFEDDEDGEEGWDDTQRLYGCGGAIHHRCTFTSSPFIASTSTSCRRGPTPTSTRG